jgi:hypothetical protein
MVVQTEMCAPSETFFVTKRKEEHMNNAISQGIHKSSHLYAHSLVIKKYSATFIPKNVVEMCSAKHADNWYQKPQKLRVLTYSNHCL